MLLLIPCIITVCNQKLFKETASISYLNGGLYIALITCGMIISSESGHYYLQYQFLLIMLFQPDKGKTKFDHVTSELI